MRVAAWVFLTSLFLLNVFTFSWGQANPHPVEITLCDLYQHPDQFAGKVVKVRGRVAGNDMWIDDFTEKPCPYGWASWWFFQSR